MEAQAVATDLIVFGRGLDLDSEGRVVGLTAAAETRVRTAVDHVQAHASAYRARTEGRRGTRARVIFSGGWAGAAEGLAPPPLELREGHLMLELAQKLTADSPDAADAWQLVDACAETDSDSTLENALRVREGSFLSDRDYTGTNPLGLVAHEEHLPRITFFTRKAFRLPAGAVQPVVTIGPDGAPGTIPESTLYALTRIIFLGARTPKSLRRRERLLRTVARGIRRLSRPAR